MRTNKKILLGVFEGVCWGKFWGMVKILFGQTKTGLLTCL